MGWFAAFFAGRIRLHFFAYHYRCIIDLLHSSAELH
jgi:hypothetical protein